LCIVQRRRGGGELISPAWLPSSRRSTAPIRPHDCRIVDGARRGGEVVPQVGQAEANELTTSPHERHLSSPME